MNFFFTHFPDPFCKLIKETNLGLFQASGIFHVLTKTKFWLFQKKSIVGLDTPEPLSFVGELQRFIFYF